MIVLLTLHRTGEFSDHNRRWPSCPFFLAMTTIFTCVIFKFCFDFEIFKICLFYYVYYNFENIVQDKTLTYVI